MGGHEESDLTRARFRARKMHLEVIALLSSDRNQRNLRKSEKSIEAIASCLHTAAAHL